MHEAFTPKDLWSLRGKALAWRLVPYMPCQLIGRSSHPTLRQACLQQHRPIPANHMPTCTRGAAMRPRLLFG